MSTLWFAQRCAQVVSIEGDKRWFGTVSQVLRSHQVSNVDLRFADDQCYHIINDIPDDYFDFALVDGSHRDACMKVAMRKVKNHGYVYLDNSDQYAHNPEGHTCVAENMLLSRLNESGGQPHFYVDLSPGCFSVNEGPLTQM